MSSPQDSVRPAPSGPGIPLSRALRDKELVANLREVRETLFVMSGKGGVGKSSVSVNLAVALARQGLAVGLLDLDLHGPSVARLLGLEGAVMADAQGRLLPVRHSSGLVVITMDSLLQDRDSAIIWRGPKKAAAIRQFLTEVAWGALDYLVIDSPPGTGDEHLTLLDAVPGARCLVVTTPQELSLADVRKALDFLAHTGSSVLGLVENMSGLRCPHCGEPIDLFRKGGGEALAEAYELPFLGAVPLDPAAVVAADRGIPAVLLEGSVAGAGFTALAEKVRKATAPSAKG